MDDGGASERAKWSGIKVEGAVVELLGRHGWGQGILAEKIQGKISLREKIIPQVVG